MIDELETIVAEFRNLSGESEEYHENLSQDYRFPGRDSNRAPFE
jgi:hypothetical protein